MLSHFSHVQLCVTLWTVGSPPGSSVHGILQTRILGWVAISFSRGSSHPRDQTLVSYIAGRFFTDLARGEAGWWKFCMSGELLFCSPRSVPWSSGKHSHPDSPTSPLATGLPSLLFNSLFLKIVLMGALLLN